MFFTDGFEFFKGGFGEVALKVGIAFARKDSAGGETMLVNSTFAIDLVRAFCRRS